MLEKDDIIVWVEEPLDSISAVDGIVPNVLSGYAKIVNISVLHQ